jgi:hypothetical protein
LLFLISDNRGDAVGHSSNDNFNIVQGGKRLGRTPRDERMIVSQQDTLSSQDIPCRDASAATRSC